MAMGRCGWTKLLTYTQPEGRQRVPAASRRAHDEQVVAVALDPDREFDRVRGAFLSRDDAHVLNLIGGGKGELPRIATVREFWHRQGSGGVHLGR